MKKALLFFSILLGITFATQAQKQGKMASKTPDQVATSVSSKMAAKYSLNDDQKSKLYQAVLTRTTKVREVRAKYPNASTNQMDKKAMRQELRPLRDSFQSDIQGILTADQYTKFQSDIDARKAQKGKGNAKPVSSPTEDIDNEVGE